MTVIVALTAAPFSVIDGGLNVQEAPTGAPLQLNVASPWIPPTGVMLRVVDPDWPAVIVGNADICVSVISGVTSTFTVTGADVTLLCAKLSRYWTVSVCTPLVRATE